MKKIAIITLSDFNNYGNRLQNYALERIIRSQGYEVVSLVNYRPCFPKTILKTIVKKDSNEFTYRIKNLRRLRKFLKFDKKYVHTLSVNAKDFRGISDDEYYCFIVGSDQVWNPDWAKYTYDWMFLRFCSPAKRISYAASFGVDKIPEEWTSKYREGLMNFKALSVREDKAVDIVKSITGIICNKVLDPTMLLDKSEWNIIKKMPSNVNGQDYILTYFLGGRTSAVNETVYRYAKSIDSTVINLQDCDTNYYTVGPDEFVGLISEAKMVLTDSFHATVFSIIYEKPFVVYDRQGNGRKMGSRLSSLLEMCDLNDRKASELDEQKLLYVNYEKARLVIQREKVHSLRYLNEAIQSSEDSVG